VSDLDRQATGADDDDETLYMASLELAPTRCPACGSDDLHSAALDDKDAISCGECEWIATLESFQRSHR